MILRSKQGYTQNLDVCMLKCISTDIHLERDVNIWNYKLHYTLFLYEKQMNNGDCSFSALHFSKHLLLYSVKECKSQDY